MTICRKWETKSTFFELHIKTLDKPESVIKEVFDRKKEKEK